MSGILVVALFILVLYYFPKFIIENEEENDASAITEVASFLEISEFQLFSIAYALWYQTSLTKDHEKVMGKLFGNYLVSEEIPFWVRHCVRKFQLERDKNILDTSAYLNLLSS